MHHNNEVSIHFLGLSAQGESPAGVGWLVEPSVVLMRSPGRGATPGRPSHVTVPASSGGGRAEDIPVLETHDSELLAEWVALQLDRDSPLPVSGAVPEGIDLSALSAADVSRGMAGDGAVLDGWVCRCFPRLPGCR